MYTCAIYGAYNFLPNFLHGVEYFKILLFRNYYLKFDTRLFDVFLDDDPTGIKTCRRFHCFNII
jgi:hypothetical protein